MTEGRRAFLERVAGIEGGSECERLAPLVSLLADGELSADELRLLRPHLKSCLACRARLREYRAAPARVAALVPPVALAGGADPGPLRGLLESLLGATSDRAGGGATVDRLASPDGSPPRDQPVDVSPVEHPKPSEPPRDQPVSTTPPAEQPAPAPAPEQTPAPTPQPQPAPPPDPANEFTPAPAPTTKPARPAPPTGNSFSPGGGGGSGARGEFGP